ncbi:uncharacterized protein LOC142897694 isoform X2 [Nelusetta ayraudi]
MMLSSSLLRHYEQTLKEELERRKTSYNHDMKVYEERLANYRKTFESHREHYCQNPLAQKLLTLQAQKEEIESRIKACDDEITMKQMELDQLTAIDSSTTEDLQHSVSDQEPINEPAKCSNLDTEEEVSYYSTDVSFPPLSQTKDAHKTHEEVNEEDHDQDTAQNLSSEEVSDMFFPEPNWEGAIDSTEQVHKTGPEDQVMEQPSDVEDIEEAEMEEGEAAVKEQPQSKQHNSAQSVCPQSPSQESDPQASPATVTSTPTFSFSFSPSRSPLRESPATKSTAFPFSLNSEPSTPAFPGFGFDENSSQDGVSSFAFAGSFLKEKETTETKSLSCPGFLFDQQEEGEDFQFAFSSKSPQTTTDNSREDFQFPFNF